MEEKEVIFVGLDIYGLVEEIFKKFPPEDRQQSMTEREKKAYRLGTNNILGLLKQTLNELILDDKLPYSCYDYIAVHIPGLIGVEEFSTISEAIKRKQEITYCKDNSFL